MVHEVGHFGVVYHLDFRLCQEHAPHSKNRKSSTVSTKTNSHDMPSTMIIWQTIIGALFLFIVLLVPSVKIYF
jgi:hypothetical protein